MKLKRRMTLDKKKSAMTPLSTLPKVWTITMLRSFLRDSHQSSQVQIPAFKNPYLCQSNRQIIVRPATLASLPLPTMISKLKHEAQLDFHLEDNSVSKLTTASYKCKVCRIFSGKLATVTKARMCKTERKPSLRWCRLRSIT